MGGAAEAWKTLASHLAPGGVLLMAQGFWTQEPTPAASQVLGSSPGDLPVGVPALVECATDTSSARDLTEALVERVLAFDGGLREDDMTLVAVRCLPDGS